MIKNRIRGVNVLPLIMLILLLSTGCSMESRGVTYGDSLFTDRDFDSYYRTEEAVIIGLREDSPLISIPEGKENSVKLEKMTGGENIIIQRDGIYVLEGRTSCCSITVDANKDSKVQLVLRGVDITSEEASCIYVKNADKVFITLEEGTENTLRDSTDEVVIDETGTSKITEEHKLESVIYAEDDIIFQGKGSLYIMAAVRDGIYCENDIKITDGCYDIKAKHTAVKARDSIRIAGGSIAIDCGADALHVEEGYFYTRATDISIKCVDDAIHSETELTIADGNVDIKKCREGLEGNAVEIYSGKLKINAIDDTINAFGTGENIPYLKVFGGTLCLKSEGDCLDSNGIAVIEGGTVYMFSAADDDDGAVDTIEGFTVLGGDVIAVESAGITDADIGRSGIRKLAVSMDESCSAGTLFQIIDSSGNTIFSFTPKTDYKNVFICSSKLKDEEYTATSGSYKQKIVSVE